MLELLLLAQAPPPPNPLDLIDTAEVSDKAIRLLLPIAILLVVNIPCYIGIGYFYFGSWRDFGESLRYLISPWWLSLINDESHEDAWYSIKFLIFVVTCIALVVAEWKLLHWMGVI
ncbi:hypothetical protein [Calycomorphotria hydatis]|uniref:Uncharacterized protein n=1 Tax=Calycomorphotria hydatis TaxID=2528027 RepID=A0A517T6J2_9PLAN|nr:hypothetical protein [Calycomorphotria hydatis]QDT63978.1 hypothetical protein V22_12080 [Calycomorphotria hydatis]